MPIFKSDFSQNINDIHPVSYLVNVEPYHEPHGNTSYRDNFDFHRGFSDRRLSFVGRRGFKRCGGALGGVVDVKDIGGIRYILSHDYERGVGSIQVQCPDCKVGCTSHVDSCCARRVGSVNFIITDCTSPKIQETNFVKGEPNFQTLSIGNELVGTTVQGYVDGLSGATVGCYVYIRSEGATQGQVREIVQIIGNKIIVDSPFQGIDDPTEEGIAFEQQDVQVGLYCERGPVPTFATEGGIRFLSKDACDGSGGLTSQVFGNGNSDASDIFEYDGQYGYIDANTGFIFLGQFGFNNGYFLPQNTLFTGGGYDTSINFGGVLVLVGPENIGYVYRTGQQIDALPDVGFEKLGSIGYYTRESIDEYLQNGYFLGSDRELYQIDLQYIGNLITGGPRYKPVLKKISKYIREDLKQLDRCAGDRVCLQVNSEGIKIFINNNNFDGTKILIYYEDYGIWVKRYTCEQMICLEHKGCWYGDLIYHLDGLYDDSDEEIVQVVGMMFDAEPFIKKNFKQLVGRIGDLSINKGNTYISSKLDQCGFQYVENYKLDDLGLFCNWNSDKKSLPNKYLHTKPFGEDIYSRADRENDPDYHSKDQKALCDYDIEELRNNSKCLEVECDCDGEVKDVQEKSPIDKYTTFAKQGVIGRPIEKDGNVLYWEFVADKGDRLHIAGMATSYAPFNEDGPLDICPSNVIRDKMVC